MKTYEENDIVFFRLTEKGNEIWKKRWGTLRYHDPNGEWLRSSLWLLMETLGPYIKWGSPSLFTEISFDDPLENIV